MARFVAAAAAVTVMSIMSAAPLNATVTTFTSASEFAAAAAVQHSADFSGLPHGRFYAPFTQDGITFTALGQDFYGTSPGEALTRNPNSFPTAALSADGDENFEFKLASGTSFNAIGLDYATNAYGAPTLYLYSLAGTLISSVPVAIAPNTVGFFGVVSTTAIGSVRSIVDRGYIADTAIDNVRIGNPALTAAAAVPEPATWGLMLVGFGAIGASMRSRRKLAVNFG